MGFRVLGTGSALPARSVTNDDLSEFLDTSDEWISTRTGISSRRICTTETLDELAVEASRRALEAAGVTAEQLDLIVCSTTSGDHLIPAAPPSTSPPPARASSLRWTPPTAGSSAGEPGARSWSPPRR